MTQSGITVVWIGDVPGTPLGDLWAALSPGGLVAISLWPERARIERLVGQLTSQSPTYAPERITAVADQLRAYLNKALTAFALPIDWSVLTPFQADALRVVSDIPYGQTRTYGDVARQLGQPEAARAVGRANATNPMPLVIPCHRVVGRDGRLQGYAAPGGAATKAWLLRLEGSRLV